MDKKKINIILISLMVGSFFIVLYGSYAIYLDDEVIGEVAVMVEEEFDGEFSGKDVVTNKVIKVEKEVLEVNETNENITSDEAIGIVMFESGKRVAIYNGPTDYNMKIGIGKIKDNVVLNEKGNSVLLGHNDGSFKELRKVMLGDIIKIKTRDVVLQYEVIDAYVTNADNPIPYRSSDEVMVTLITCYPFFYLGNTSKRYVVVAKGFD